MRMRAAAKSTMPIPISTIDAWWDADTSGITYDKR